MRFRVLASMLVVSSLAWSAAASAADDDKPKKKSDAASADASTGKHDPANVTGISPFMEKLSRAEKLVAARDFTGAIAAIRDAITEDTKNPLGHFMLGEAQIIKGDLGEAEASWKTALANIGANDDLHAKILFGMADLRERQGKMDEAKAAWTEYGKFAADHPKARAYPATAGERQKVIDVHNDLAVKYGEVKARIAAREKELKDKQQKDAQKDADANDKKPRK
jgi:TolA-binding protein